MSPWLLPQPLWLYPVSCPAQTPTSATGSVPCRTCQPPPRWAPSRWRRRPPPFSPISESSNRRNRRTAIKPSEERVAGSRQWTQREKQQGTYNKTVTKTYRPSACVTVSTVTSSSRLQLYLRFNNPVIMTACDYTECVCVCVHACMCACMWVSLYDVVIYLFMTSALSV